jgi:hypothetical protein
MTELDLEDAYEALRNSGCTPENRIGELDVLIESFGGDPVAGYRLAQLVRSFASRVDVLVAEHAYSAATLFSFGADRVRLAHFAGLSPIDITLVSEPGDRPRHEVELATVDSVLEFAATARKRIEMLLKELGSEGRTNVDSDILVAAVKQVGALQVGKFFRERTLTGHYAEELLGSYMFASRLDRKDCCEHAIRRFLFDAPGHEVHLDLNMARKWGLIVDGMDTDESDMAKEIVSALEEMARKGLICPWLSRTDRFPFIAFYAVAQPVQRPSVPAATEREAGAVKEEQHEAARTH